jgi:CarD family transcriptional regulator
MIARFGMKASAGSTLLEPAPKKARAVTRAAMHDVGSAGSPDISAAAKKFGVDDPVPKADLKPVAHRAVASRAVAPGSSGVADFSNPPDVSGASASGRSASKIISASHAAGVRSKTPELTPVSPAVSLSAKPGSARPGSGAAQSHPAGKSAAQPVEAASQAVKMIEAVKMNDKTAEAPEPTVSMSEAAAPVASTAQIAPAAPVAPTAPAAPAALAAQAAPSAPGAHSARGPAQMVNGRPAPISRASNKDEIFSQGDFVVYPTHGVGKVERIAVEDIAGHKLELIHITFEENRMTLRVPVAKARSAGLRRLATRKMFDEALAVLKGRARIKRTMWSRRAQEYEAKINSGDPIAIAEVVRDLHRNSGQPDQSFSERQIYEAAMDRLAAELAALDQTDKMVASVKLANFLKTV